MGIFSDFANSAAGDLTIGAFEGLNQAAQKDVVVNATASNDALRKENDAFLITETAFKNRKEIANILAANPDAFGLNTQEGLGIDQVADRFANFMFLQNRSIFENKDMDKVKLNVAKFMASNPGEGFDVYDPYVSGEDRFNQEKELHQARISEISKMPKADKLLMNIKEAEAEVATPEAITNELTKVAALTAKGFGILNTYPTSQEGFKNLQFVQVNLITANAKAQFPNDAVARAQFIDQRLYDNNIDPTDGIMYSNNLNFRIMAKAIDTMGGANANKIAELTNAIAAAPDAETRKQLNDQMNTIVLDSHKIMNTYSTQAGSLMAGENRDQVFPNVNTDSIGLPQVMEGYVPSIDGSGNVVIELANGNTQNIPLEVLIDSPDSVKLLPQVTQNYVNQIKENLFVDGEMIEPKREMFEEGRAGDKAFKDFLSVYNIFFPDASDEIFDKVETLEPTPKKKLTDGDISQIKKDKKEDGNTIKVEELAPANTIIPKKKPDVPVKAEEPKEKTLQDKIQEDFGKPNVGISGGDTTTKEDVKTDTQIQTEDVFEGSGVEPMYQSASLKEKFGEGGTTFQKLTKNKNMEFAYNYLNKTLSPEASAALLGNMYAEGGNFAFDQEEVTDRTNKGYGLFQFTDVKDGEGHRTEYFKYLGTNDKQDSIESQIDYVMANINQGIGYDIGAGNRKKLQKIFKTGTVEQITKAFHDIFERPQPGSLKKRTNFAEQAYTFYKGI
mgnify:CR=1 FL=1